MWVLYQPILNFIKKKIIFFEKQTRMSLVNAKYIEYVDKRNTILIPYFFNLVPKEISLIIITFTHESMHDHFIRIFLLLTRPQNIYFFSPNNFIGLDFKCIDNSFICIEGAFHTDSFNVEEIIQHFNEKSFDSILKLFFTFFHTSNSKLLANVFYQKYEIASKKILDNTFL